MSKVVDIARSYIGKVKYVFGAQDPDNGRSDCSGFTMVVFQKAGYSIPRTTGGVWTDSSLQNVDKRDLQEGDLILFKDTYNSGMKDNCSHIGIYSGNGKFIHCGTAGVSEASLNEQYWVNHYLGAKRVTGASSGVSDGVIENVFGGSLGEKMGLKWWGDVVTVIVSVLLILAGIVLLVLGVKGTVYDKVIKEVI